MDIEFIANLPRYLQPYHHHEQLYKKSKYGITFSRAANHWFKVPKPNLKIITQIGDYVNNTLHLLNNINAFGSLEAHNIFGINFTLNSIHYISFQMISEIMKSFPKNIQVNSIRAVIESKREVHRGYGLDIFYLNATSPPSEVELTKISTKRSAASIKLFLDLLQLFSDSKLDFSNFAKLYGYFTELRTDYLSLKSTDTDRINDYIYGKFTLQMLHAIEADLDDFSLLYIIKQRSDDADMRAHVIKQMEETGSFEFAVQKMTELKGQLVEEIKVLGGNGVLEQILDTALNFEN